MTLVSTLHNNTEIWEAFYLQAGTHNMNTDREMAPHCARSCTHMKENVGCQEIWRWSEREGLDLCASDSLYTRRQSCKSFGVFWETDSFILVCEWSLWVQKNENAWTCLQVCPDGAGVVWLMSVPPGLGHMITKVTALWGKRVDGKWRPAVCV